MRKPAFAFAIVASLAACEALPRAPAAGPPSGASAPTPSEVAGLGLPPRGDALTYFCSDGTVVQADYPDEDEADRLGTTARLLIDGQGVRMIQATSATGVRYIGSGLQWWARGLRVASLAPLAPGESIASSPGTECRAGG